MSADNTVGIGIIGEYHAAKLMDELLKRKVPFQFDSHGDDHFEFIVNREHVSELLKTIQDGALGWITDTSGMNRLLGDMILTPEDKQAIDKIVLNGLDAHVREHPTRLSDEECDNHKRAQALARREG